MTSSRWPSSGKGGEKQGCKLKSCDTPTHNGCHLIPFLNFSHHRTSVGAHAEYNAMDLSSLDIINKEIGPTIENQGGAKWRVVVHLVTKWCKEGQVVELGQKWCKVGQGSTTLCGAKWCQMVECGTNWGKVLLLGAPWYILGHLGANSHQVATLYRYSNLGLWNWSQVEQSGAKWSQVVQSGSVWCKVGLLAPFWGTLGQTPTKWLPYIGTQIWGCGIGPKWSKVVPSGAKWCKVVAFGAKWGSWHHFGAPWGKLPPCGARWNNMGQCGAKWVKWCTLGQVGAKGCPHNNANPFQLIPSHTCYHPCRTCDGWPRCGML